MKDRRIQSLVLATALALGVLAGTRDSLAEPVDQEPTLAGVVVQLGDGTLREFCVDLGGSERSGMELLRMTGLSIVSEDNAQGSMICRIGGSGCDFPAEPCWCQCQDLGADCSYWSYNTLKDGRWDYAAMGAAARRVRQGDVDGWAWGRGTVSLGAQPPVRSFENLCAAALAPTPTATVAPTATRPAPTREPTATRTATRAPAPGTRSSATPRPGATARPSATPRGTFTEQASTASTPSAAMTDPAMADATSGAEPLDPDRQATLAALPAAFAALATAEKEATMLAEEAGRNDMDSSPGPQIPAEASTVAPTAAATLGAARALMPGDDAVGSTVDGASNVANEAGAPTGSLAGYLVFVLVLAVLGGMLVWFRR
jgi:hypothetical protein